MIMVYAVFYKISQIYRKILFHEPETEKFTQEKRKGEGRLDRMALGPLSLILWQNKVKTNHPSPER